MTAWCLEPKDITRRWVCCNAVLQLSSLPPCHAFGFVFSKWKVCSNEFGKGDRLGQCRTSHFFGLKKSLVPVKVCFGSLSLCTVNHHPTSFDASGWIWADYIGLYTSQVTLLLLSAVTSPSVNTREPVPQAAHVFTTYPLQKVRWYASVHEQFFLFHIPFSSHHSGTRWSLSTLSIGRCSRNCSGFLECFRQTLIWT